MLIDCKPLTIGGGNESHKGANIVSKIIEFFRMQQSVDHYDGKQE